MSPGFRVRCSAKALTAAVAKTRNEGAVPSFLIDMDMPGIDRTIGYVGITIHWKFRCLGSWRNVMFFTKPLILNLIFAGDAIPRIMV